MTVSQLESLFKHIEDHSQLYVDRLATAVAIKSVSSDASLRPQVFAMADYLKSEMDRLLISHKVHLPGKQTLEGKVIDLPPILLGKYGASPNKKTILIYGHYDVQPADISDGWDTDPFTLVEDKQGRLLGRGSTDDKAPILGWLWVVEAHQKLNIELPVNLIFCFEGMEESGSEGLDDLIIKEAKDYFKDVDCVCISDNCINISSLLFRLAWN